MRTLLFALCLTAGVSAQPVARALEVAAPSPASSSPYQAAAATTVGIVGATLGAGGSVMATVLATYSAGGTDSDDDLEVVYVAIGTVGGVAGAALFTRLLGEREATYRGIVPYHGIGPNDWRRALVGALVGSLPGIGAAVLLGPSESGLEWLALPIAQGIGSGIAVSIGR